MNSEVNRGYSSLLEIQRIWKSYLSQLVFVVEFIVTLILLISIISLFALFLNSIEARNGVQFKDPFLALIKPINLSALTFLLIYSSLIGGIITLSKNPPRLLFAFHIYILLLAFRILTLYLVPLNPPENMILLNDPVVKYLGTGQNLSKDLFFSGHTATIFILFLVVNNKKIKILFLIGFIILAIALLLQHVHYTIDIVSAPFFAYTCYRMVLLIGKRYKF